MDPGSDGPDTGVIARQNAAMRQSSRGKTVTAPQAAERWYGGAAVPMSVIRRHARLIADRFQPEKIILFGSYAYGTPHSGSDVDLLVIMPARNELDQRHSVRSDA
jgi:hypothetical protein